MTEKKCPHCGKEIPAEQSQLEISPEAALVELVLAHLARIYREEFSLGFPTEGESDLEALQQLFESLNSEDENLTVDAVSMIIDNWRVYLQKRGRRGTVSDFVFKWLPAHNPGAKVIPFRPRFE